MSTSTIPAGVARALLGGDGNFGVANAVAGSLPTTW